ncbi:uncharacterized protein LOC121764659 isoform X2 [Salvia splendens]|uniref:uncharacterized protein LOC121764659 isoform X2 n=1 Tax=Salvia splendens TaxID=180675 RepID=UPI001C26A185|nr:uncharacterized protein LOC121764659 isoform X2 [Salvia splendens]
MKTLLCYVRFIKHLNCQMIRLNLNQRRIVNLLLKGTSDILASPTNLILSTNQSTGSKPEELGNLTSLINLQLGANHLEALVGLGYPVGYSSGYWNYCHQVHTSVVMIHRREI